MIAVIDLKTGEHTYYNLDDPSLAVMCAYAQAGDDWRENGHEEKYGHLVTHGKLHVSCGDHAALLDNVLEEMDEVRAADY